MHCVNEKTGGGKHPFAMDVSLLSNPFLEDDDMMSWLRVENALDRSVSGAHHIAKDCFVNDQSSMMIMRRDGDSCRATAEAAMAMGAGRAAGRLPQVGADSFTRVRTSVLPSRSTAACSEHAFPSTLTPTPTPPQQHYLRPQSNMASAIAPPKTSFHISSTSMDRLSRPFASLGKEAFKPCLRSKAATAGIASSQQPDFCPHSREQTQQDTGFCLPPTFRLDQCRNPVTETVEHCHCDASSILGSTIVDVPPSLGSDISTEKSAKDIGTVTSIDRPRPGEESEQRSEVVEAAAKAKKPPSGRSSLTKRTRAAEIHNLSERKRRDKINLKMKALQELIPNANKTDKASMLDEAIEYMKMLQAQIQFISMRSGTVVPSMMMVPGMPYFPTQETLVFPHTGMGMGTGIGMAGEGAARGGTCLPGFSLPPLHGQSLSKPVCNTSEIQSNRASSVTDEAPDDLQNSRFIEPYQVIPVHHQQLPIQFSMQPNADIYNPCLSCSTWHQRMVAVKESNESINLHP